MWTHTTPSVPVKLAPAELFGALPAVVVPEFCAVQASPYDWQTSPAWTTSPALQAVHPSVKARDLLAFRIRHAENCCAAVRLIFAPEWPHQAPGGQAPRVLMQIPPCVPVRDCVQRPALRWIERHRYVTAFPDKSRPACCGPSRPAERSMDARMRRPIRPYLERRQRL